MPEDAFSLERWGNFYVTASTAAATLIGLLFVLITLSADRRPKDIAKIRIYLTPTVIYFGSVLCLAALLTFPSQSRFTATLCTYVVGGPGVLYSVSLVVVRGVKKRQYYQAADIVVYGVLPSAAYGLLVSGGIALGHAAQRGLTLMASGMLALIALAHRNSWAIAVEMVTAPPQEP